MLTNFWIYTRTSSLTTFAKDSPERQILMCKDYLQLKYPDVSIKGIFKDNCSSEIAIDTRTAWKNLSTALLLHIGERNIIVTESLSRLGRDTQNLDFIRDYARENNVEIIPIGNEGLFEVPLSIWPILRDQLSNMLTAEKERLVNALAIKRELTRLSPILPGTILTSKGIPRFDGRNLYTNKYPTLLSRVKELGASNLTISQLSLALKSEGFTSKQGNALSYNTVASILKEARRGFMTLAIRAYSSNIKAKILTARKRSPEEIEELEERARKRAMGPLALAKLFNYEARKLGTHIIWADNLKNYLIYTKDRPYWRIISPLHTKALILKVLGDIVFSRLDSILKALSLLNMEPDFVADTTLLSLANGRFNLITGKFQPHSFKDRVFYMSTHMYDPKPVRIRDMPNLFKWFRFVTKRDTNIMQFLVLYAYLVIFGLTKYHIYLEIVGPGGTGKSTLLNILTALVGKEQVYISDLQTLEQNKFETANLLDKKLILVTDSPNYRGSLSVLKAITGEDDLRFEEKGKQCGASFRTQALIVIASNEYIAAKDYSSGLSRRRIIVTFSEKPAKVETLLERDTVTNTWTGTLAKEVPLLLNFILQISPELVDQLMRNRQVAFPSLIAHASHIQDLTNPIHGFITTFIRPAAENKDKLYLSSHLDRNFLMSLYREILSGKTRIRIPEYAEDDQLFCVYPVYLYYCQLHGNNPVSLNIFSTLFEDNYYTINKVKLKKEKDSKRGVYYRGITILFPVKSPEFEHTNY